MKSNPRESTSTPDQQDDRQMEANHNRDIIWIDLDNSPHVPFFKPIIKELRKRDYEIIITARDCFQVCGLADLLDLEYNRVGRHYGKNKFMKIAGTVIRSLKLIPFVFKTRPCVAISHGSRSQLLAAKMLGITSVMIFDYEHAQSLVAIGPTWCFVPELIAKSLNNGYCHNVLAYPGIKEDVYVPDFKPGPPVGEALGISQSEIIVTIRPPATEAHYHNPASEELFAAIINLLGQKENVRMLLLPRNKRQEVFIRAEWPELCHSNKLVIPEHVLDGLNLMWYSDLVVSGGGTMNREAAALGVPVYSIFRGTIGAVDKYLAQAGRLVLLETVEDIYTKLEVKKRHIQYESPDNESVTLNTIVASIVNIVEKDLV
jgi:uncharacterized protein